jgi:hypothetical protein
VVEKRMTPFGKKIHNLAADRADIYNWAQLERVLNEDGFEISRQQISNYVYGDSVATAEFVKHFCRITNLNDEECKDLAYSWGFEQEREDKEDHRTHIFKVAYKLGWNEEERRQLAYLYIFGAGVLSMSA